MPPTTKRITTQEICHRLTVAGIKPFQIARIKEVLLEYGYGPFTECFWLKWRGIGKVCLSKLHELDLVEKGPFFYPLSMSTRVANLLNNRGINGDFESVQQAINAGRFVGARDGRGVGVAALKEIYAFAEMDSPPKRPWKFHPYTGKQVY